MGKRLLNCMASDFAKMSAPELKQAILASEGRTILSENIVVWGPVADGITNAEAARAVGADLILLNMFDCFKPVILGFPGANDQELDSKCIHTLKKLVGRPVGVNLEPVDESADMAESRLKLPEGRICSERTLERAQKLGFDFICLTGNPATGVSNRKISNAIKKAKKFFSGLVIAGKMHGAGVNEPVADSNSIDGFIGAGADIILLPAVGTVPGFTENEMVEAVRKIKAQGALVMSAIGTSQEGADQATIQQIAIKNKIAGVDIQHIGDCGYGGVACLENIFTMSVAIRGKRHTIRRMAASNER